MFECVINVSEGRDHDILDQIAATCSGSLRDLHRDAFHNRSVFTLINDAPTLTSDVRALIESCFRRLDLRRHEGVHPRFGVVDVVPFVALDPERRSTAVGLRDETGHWIADNFDVPVFFYGPLDDGFRTLPEIRRLAFTSLKPDVGPDEAAPTLGAVAVGERPVMLAWNIWLRGVALERARHLAAGVRRPEVRSLAFRAGDQVQVSCNLITPDAVGPAVVYDEVLAQLGPGEEVDHAELVGLAPMSVLRSVDRVRWTQLGLSEESTIEGRLA